MKNTAALKPPSVLKREAENKVKADERKQRGEARNTGRAEASKRAEERRERGAIKAISRNKLQTAPFLAWDGEGYTDDKGKHHYMLFGNSDGEHVTGKSLTWRQCFPLLLAKRGPVNHVIFGGDYDIIMMIKSMPLKVRERLHAGKPTRYAGYRMHWHRRKQFMLSNKRLNRSIILYDVHSFFQTTFVKACRTYLGESAELDAMHGMKLKRDAFTLADESVIPYWQSELDHLVRLMDELRRLFAEVEIRPHAWYGPGAVANAVLKARNMKRYYSTLPDEIVDIAERAYFGGRFEQFKVGKLSNVIEYDIRSAYPDAIRHLPDFSQASWSKVDSPDPMKLNPFGLYEISWDMRPTKDTPRSRVYLPYVPGPFPWRSEKGQIYFPQVGFRSWYWGVEVSASLVRCIYPECYTIHAGWEPSVDRTTAVNPFSWIADMYEDRARMKAEGNPAERALKLALNSIYGKLAQSAGAHQYETGEWRKPSWHHIAWAGWVTAFTRGKLRRAVSTHAEMASIVAIETDAIFTLRPLSRLEEVGLSTDLGDWERTDLEQILYVHSGVYYALSDGVWRLKSRGIEADKSKSADHWLEIFGKLPQHPQNITLTLRRFGTDLRSEHYGNWYSFKTTTNIPNSMSKRMHNVKRCAICFRSKGLATYADCHHLLVVPQALITSDCTSSAPYAFPWRTDVTYDWPEIVRADVIELPEELAWN